MFGASSLSRIAAARWPRAPVNKRLSSDARKNRIHRARLVSPSSSLSLLSFYIYIYIHIFHRCSPLFLRFYPLSLPFLFFPPPPRLAFFPSFLSVLHFVSPFSILSLLLPPLLPPLLPLLSLSVGFLELYVAMHGCERINYKKMRGDANSKRDSTKQRAGRGSARPTFSPPRGERDGPISDRSGSGERQGCRQLSRGAPGAPRLKLKSGIWER